MKLRDESQIRNIKSSSNEPEKVGRNVHYSPPMTIPSKYSPAGAAEFIGARHFGAAAARTWGLSGRAGGPWRVAVAAVIS